MSDLDLSNVLASAGPGNFDWLDVDERDYRSRDVLPKQNLDIVPDLKAQWSHAEREPIAYFVPNRDLAGYPIDSRVPAAPRTMGDLSELHGPLHGSPVGRAARLALTESSNPVRLQEALLLKFSRAEILENRTALAEVLEERGLLGRLYIAAADFPDCAEAKAPEEFVRRHAAEAKYVVAKVACGDCCHKQQTLSGSRCSVFHKELVQEVPYSNELADQVEHEQRARGVHASSPSGEPRARIRAAFTALNATVAPIFTGQDNTGAIIPASRLLRKVSDASKAEAEVQAARARPIVALVRRELLKGRRADEVMHGLRLAFDVRDLKASQEHWVPLFKEAGLYGAIYSTQDSFDDCREGADFLSKHSSKVRAIVAGEKCKACIFAKVGRCLMYGRKLVASLDDVYTTETVASVIDECRLEGTISPALARQKWGSTPRESLQNIHAAKSRLAVAAESARMSIQHGFYGTQSQQHTGTLTKRSVLASAARFMNEGLYGVDLKAALQSKFDPRDILASGPELRSLVATNQGLQGIYFIDPTVYEDYGMGCKEAQRLHRSRSSIKYATVGPKCGSCIHQTQPGVCSVLDKRLASEPPYENKVAQQRAILASGRSVENDYGSLVNNGLTMMQEFELKGAGTIVEFAPDAPTFDASIQFGNNELDLKVL